MPYKLSALSDISSAAPPHPAPLSFPARVSVCTPLGCEGCAAPPSPPSPEESLWSRVQVQGKGEGTMKRATAVQTADPPEPQSSHPRSSPRTRPREHKGLVSLPLSLLPGREAHSQLLSLSGPQAAHPWRKGQRAFQAVKGRLQATLTAAAAPPGRHLQVQALL